MLRKPRDGLCRLTLDTDPHPPGNVGPELCSNSSTHMHIHARTYTCAHMCTHVHTSTHPHIHMHMHTPTHPCTHMHPCAYTHTHVHTDTHPHIHMHIYTPAHTHLPTYTHTHKHLHTHTPFTSLSCRLFPLPHTFTPRTGSCPSDSATQTGRPPPPSPPPSPLTPHPLPPSFFPPHLVPPIRLLTPACASGFTNTGNTPHLPPWG